MFCVSFFDLLRNAPGQGRSWHFSNSKRCRPIVGREAVHVHSEAVNDQVYVYGYGYGYGNGNEGNSGRQSGEGCLKTRVSASTSRSMRTPIFLHRHTVAGFEKTPEMGDGLVAAVSADVFDWKVGFPKQFFDVTHPDGLDFVEQGVLKG